jgi:glycosyltransferase involved in cell wall biosynthesis
MQPLISVIIPSYNYEAYLEQAIASVQAQSYRNLELVVLDDGSSDGSWSLLETLRPRLQERFSGRVTIRQNPQNMGAHATINAALAAATGDYFAILNADDCYEPDRFTVMMAKLQEAGSMWGFSAVRCMGADGKPLAGKQADAFERIQEKLKGKRVTALAAVAENVCISSGNLLFSRQLYEGIGPFKNYLYVHDYDFFLRACLYDEPVFVPETAYWYRLHGENSFLSLHKEGVRENRVVWLEFYRAVQEGRIANRAILQAPDFVQEFYQVVCAEGRKKQTLWKLARNPLARAGLKAFKARYHMD